MSREASEGFAKLVQTIVRLPQDSSQLDVATNEVNKLIAYNQLELNRVFDLILDLFCHLDCKDLVLLELLKQLGAESCSQIASQLVFFKRERQEAY